MRTQKSVQTLIDEGAKYVSVSFKGKTRDQRRRKLYALMGKQKFGTGRSGKEVSRYVYEVMSMEGAGVRVFFLRPTAYARYKSKPIDFHIQVEDEFGPWPSAVVEYKYFFNYLKDIRAENLALYKKVEEYIEKVYTCQDVDYKEVSLTIKFNTGKPFAAMLAVIEMFFMGEDVANGEVTGRGMTNCALKLLDGTYSEAMDAILSKKTKGTPTVTTVEVWRRVFPNAEVSQRWVQYALDVLGLLKTKDKALKKEISCARGPKVLFVDKWKSEIIKVFNSIKEGL